MLFFDVDLNAKTIRVNSSLARSDETKSGGGTNVYQLASTFAQQHKLKFLPDYSVDPKAQNRRISHIVSSLLRHGTSDHFDGNATFKDSQTGEIKTELPGWKPGDHDHNLALALRREHDYVMAAAKAKGIDLSHLTYDPETRTIINGHTGTALTQGALESLVGEFKSRDSGVGATTLLRALVTGSTLQGQTTGGGVRPLLPDSGGDPRGDTTGESDRWVVSLARDLYYSRAQSSAGGLPSRRMGDALSERPNGLATAVAQVSDHLKTQVPGLLNDRTHVFHSTEDFLNSDYAKKHPLSKEDLEKLHSAEGFHDPQTGHNVVIAGNVELRPGETPHDALTRVILHERVGHDGLQTLLGSKNSKAQKHWEGLTQRIKPEELNAIASQEGYQHLKDNPTALAHEWFARQVEKSPHMLKQPGLVRDMWEAFKGQLRKLINNRKNTDESHLDTHLHELMRLSRKAALKRPSASNANGAMGANAASPPAHPEGQLHTRQFSLASDSSSGSLPHGDTSTTHGVTPPSGTSAGTLTSAANTAGTTLTASSAASTAPGGNTHTTNGVTAPPVDHGNRIPEDTTHPEHIDLAKKRVANLGKIAAKRKLDPHEQDIYDNALRVRDRNAPSQPGDRNSPPPEGTRNTSNPDDLAMSGDADALVPVTPDGEDASLDAAADTPPAATPAQPANAIGSTINGPGSAIPDAPTASAGSPTPPPLTGPAGTAPSASTTPTGSAASTPNGSPTGSATATSASTSASPTSGSSAPPSAIGGNPASTSGSPATSPANNPLPKLDPLPPIPFPENSPEARIERQKREPARKILLEHDGIKPADKSKVLGIDKGKRPDPKTYMSDAFIKAHREEFLDGASRIIPTSNLSKYGPAQADGTSFVFPTHQMSDILKEAGGDRVKLEDLLGIPRGQLGSRPLSRVDFKNPASLNIRIGLNRNMGDTCTGDMGDTARPVF